MVSKEKRKEQTITNCTLKMVAILRLFQKIVAVDLEQLPVNIMPHAPFVKGSETTGETI